MFEIAPDVWPRGALSALACVTCATGILFAHPAKTLTYTDFNLRLGMALLAMLTIDAFAFFVFDFWFYIWVVVGVIFTFFQTIWSVYRVQDFGGSRWYCLAYLLIPLTPLLWIYLGRKRPDEEETC